MTARRASDGEILGHGGPDRGSIELGTVGWEDGGKHFDPKPGGVVFVKVRLFRGRNPDSEPAKESTRAKGHKIMCQISQPLLFIPSDGAQVMVAIPAVFGGVDGAAMIIGVAGKSPVQQFGGDDGNSAMLDFGPDRRVIIKAGKGVILSDYENRWFGVGPEFGVKCGDESGSGFQLKERKWVFYATKANGNAVAALQLAEAGIKINHNDSAVSSITMKGGSTVVGGTKFWTACGATYLGPTANVSSFALYMLLGVPTPSSSVYVGV